MEAYVTLAEAAELEEIDYHTLVVRISRNPQCFFTKKEKRSGGGKELVTVAVSCLSRKARAAYKEREKLRAVAAPPEDAEPADRAQPPWYVGKDVDWFMNHHKKEWYKAMELGNVVRDFLDYDEKGRCKYADSFAKERLGKDKRTLYRYTKAYLEACAWADKLEKQDGCNYDFLKVLCLCRKPKDSGTFPSFTPEVKQAIKNIWFNRDFAANQGTREMLYEKLTLLAQINGWEKIPSYQSVVRYIHYLMEDENMRNAWYLASRGEREYKNKVMVKGRRDSKSLKVMEIVMGDEHTFDCWVAYTQPNGSVIAIKPHLAAWIDMRSRMILGDVVCKNATSKTLKRSLCQLMYQDAGCVPEYLYIDNGKDYTAKTMTGRPRNDRGGMQFDSETKGFYKSIGIKDDHRALPYEPWSKAQIERFFRTVCNQFTRWFTSYTGTLTGSKTIAKVEKDVKQMLERGELVSMEEFYQLWSKWLHEVYMNKRHKGLQEAGEEWLTPRECFDNAERYVKPVPPKSQATVLMMESKSRFVMNIGIRLFGREYRSQELCDYIGQTLDIKYDPNDMGTIYVFKDQKQVCEAYCQELLQIAPKVHQKALEDHIKMQKTQIRRDKGRLNETQMTLEEINEQYLGFDDTASSIDLMIGSKGKPAKVVSMPQDATYRNGFRSGRKEEAEEENEYISRQAEEALKKLRAL